MATPPAVFRYKTVAGHAAPVVGIGICISEAWHRVEFYVDSGAYYTILGGRFAKEIGFDFTTGQRVLVQVGDGT